MSQATSPETVRETNEHSQSVGAATQEATREGPDLSELQSKEFIDTAFTPDVNRGDVPGKDNNHIEEKYSAEFGRHQGLGNIEREDWEDERKLNRAKAILAKQEYARPSGLGSRCRSGLREAWTGVEESLPMLTDDLARETTAAFEELTMMQSLSIDGRGFRGLTEVTAVARSEGYSSGDSSGGLLSKLTGGLFGS